MRLHFGTIRAWMLLTGLVGLVSLASVRTWGQDSSSGQSLGDAARNARNEHAATSVPATRVVDSDDDGPDSAGVWRIRMCARIPCYEVSITLPRNPKWTRAAAAPRPVVIPLLRSGDNPARAVRVYAAPSIEGIYSTIEASKRSLLQGWFARPEYFGHQAHIVLDEHVLVDGHNATLSHFGVTDGASKYQGFSIVANSPNGNSGFACVFRDQDAAAAISICDAVVKSATDQSLETPKLEDPQNGDPSEDPLGDNDPQ